MVPRRHGMVCPNFRGQIETQRLRFTGDCETVVAKAVRFARRRWAKSSPLAVTLPPTAALQIRGLTRYRPANFPDAVQARSGEKEP